MYIKALFISKHCFHLFVWAADPYSPGVKVPMRRPLVTNSGLQKCIPMFTASTVEAERITIFQEQ